MDEGIHCRTRVEKMGVRGGGKERNQIGFFADYRRFKEITEEWQFVDACLGGNSDLGAFSNDMNMI